VTQANRAQDAHEQTLRLYTEPLVFSPFLFLSCFKSSIYKADSRSDSHLSDCGHMSYSKVCGFGQNRVICQRGVFSVAGVDEC